MRRSGACRSSETAAHRARVRKVVTRQATEQYCVRRTRLSLQVERGRGVLCGAQRQQVGERVNCDQRAGPFIRPQSYCALVFDECLLLHASERVLFARPNRRAPYSGWRFERTAFAHWLAVTDQLRPVHARPHAFAIPAFGQNRLTPTSDATPTQPRLHVTRCSASPSLSAPVIPHRCLVPFAADVR